MTGVGNAGGKLGGDAFAVRNGKEINLKVRGNFMLDGGLVRGRRASGRPLMV